MERVSAGLVSIILAGAWGCGSSEASGPSPAETLAPSQPPCEQPRPLLGVPDVRAPGYLVIFHDTVDAEVEAARLAAAHGFRPRSVWTSALEGFSADLRREIVAELRCVSTVDYIEYNQIYTPG